MLPALSFQDQSGLRLVCSVPSSCQWVKISIRVSVTVHGRYVGLSNAMLELQVCPESSCLACSCEATVVQLCNVHEQLSQIIARVSLALA